MYVPKLLFTKAGAQSSVENGTDISNAYYIIDTD